MYYAEEMEEIDLSPSAARCVALTYIVIISAVIYFSL